MPTRKKVLEDYGLDPEERQRREAEKRQRKEEARREKERHEEENRIYVEDEMAREYEDLRKQMVRQNQPRGYHWLAQQFREMKGYKDSAALADECEFKAQSQINLWHAEGLCRNCGGNLKKLSKECTVCETINS